MRLIKNIVIISSLLSLAFAEDLALGSNIPLADVKMLDISGKKVSLNDVKLKNGLLVNFSCNTCPWVVAWQDRYNGLAEASAESNIGPHLEAIAGRRSGALPDYNYSTAMMVNNRTSVIWDSRTIAAFITNPQSIFPGTKMISTPLNFEDAVQVSNYLTRLKNEE